MTAGFIDGRSILWVVRVDRGALNVDGYQHEDEAVEALIRALLSRCDTFELPQVKLDLRAAFERGMKHLDESESEAE